MRERLLDVFRRTFEDVKINESISQKNYENWDSLNHINLIVEIENEFNISIEPDDIDKMKDFSTVEKIVMGKSGN
ncbi:MAG: acyl carrier protein [Paludibacter sp.]|nr:acyl carrier protein [Paludibacter sp.]